MDSRAASPIIPRALAYLAGRPRACASRCRQVQRHLRLLTGLSGHAGRVIPSMRTNGTAVSHGRSRKCPVQAGLLGSLHGGAVAALSCCTRPLRPEAKFADLSSAHSRIQPGPECPSASAGVRGCVRRSSLS